MSTELAQIAESTPSLPVRILSASLSFMKRRPLAAAGIFIIILMCLMAILADFVTWYDPIDWRLGDKLSPPLTVSDEEPFSTFLMGTDDKGRDIWAQIAVGAQVSLMVGFLSVAFGSGFGGVLGVVSAWFGGKTDQIIQRAMDALMSIPTLILALAVTSVLGQTIENIIIAVGVVQIPRANRVVRAQALTVKETQYVDAARAIGANNIRIMAQHITPQCVAPFLIIATSALGIAILTEASLSYLGLGVPPPRPSWGGMLSGAARDYFILAPWMAIWPGLGLSLAVYGFNLFGDGLRDALDPRLRGT
ncbi:MAG TPA: ABC transporter permease [Dehalococcoidia bacterium]|nr:ABC transporter permease [Dehalococcoidia bacterium]